MTSNRFSRRRGRVQPTPAICRLPPIPLPPGKPIETAAVRISAHGTDFYGDPFHLDAAGVLPFTYGPFEYVLTGNLTALSAAAFCELYCEERKTEALLNLLFERPPGTVVAAYSDWLDLQTLDPWNAGFHLWHPDWPDLIIQWRATA